MTVAIIGTGWGARVQVPTFQSAGLKVTALVGTDQAKTEQIARNVGVPDALSDWHSILTRDDIKLVSITTPPALHSEMAIAALQAGKHVLCEKPAAFNITQAQAMLTAAQAHAEQAALIDHELRFLPALTLARQMLTDGAIGDIRYVVSRLIDSRRSDPNRVWNWWSDAASGGGLLGAAGSHQVDLLRYLLNAEVISVSAALNTFITKRPNGEALQAVTSDDAYSLRLRFTNKTFASLEGNATTQTNEPDSITFYGTQGTLRWSDGHLYHAAAGQPFADITPPHTYTLPAGLNGAYSHASVYLGHALRAFLDGDNAAIATGATFADGLHVQTVLDAVHLSHEQRGITIELAQSEPQA
ncbi:MAG: Gfo/Idh/MocA family oxidoreductase [Chloroflexota bacterium]